MRRILGLAHHQRQVNLEYIGREVSNEDTVGLDSEAVAGGRGDDILPSAQWRKV
ncbi:MAG: hypothetical protein IPL28_06060 [Chloroflexi bacterium]|nr:hypothetical protein [Chloroflexota bacterium]